MVLIVPLTPVLNAPVLQPAFEQILPALFGGLGVAFVSRTGSWQSPRHLMLALFIFVPALNSGTVGIMVPVSALFTIATGRILYKKGILPMQYVIWSLAGCFGAFFAVFTVIRALCFKPKAQPKISGEAVDFDKDAAVSALQQLVQCKTFLQRSFPGG